MHIQKDLLAILKGLPPLPIIERYTSEDFRLLIEYASVHKLQSRVLDILTDSGVDDAYLSATYASDLDRRKTKLDTQLGVLKDIQQYINEEQYIWLKGIPQAVIVYKNPLARKIGDMDIVVQKGVKKTLVDKLLENGYQLIGAINDEVRLRFAVNFHEIQLRSPQGAFLEIKEFSGEMDVFCDDRLPFDFLKEENVQFIDLNEHHIRTSNNLYTCLHMFLAALSNSTTWFYMYDVGLRELFEIYLLKKRGDVDCEKLARITDIYGISKTVPIVMNRINSLFGNVFTEREKSFFESTSFLHPMCNAYLRFFRNLEVSVDVEITSELEKKEAYFNAIRKLYYEDGFTLEEDYLNRDLLDYRISFLDDTIKVTFWLDKQICSSSMRILFRVLNSDEEYLCKHGYFTDFVFNITNDGLVKLESSIVSEGNNCAEVAHCSVCQECPNTYEISAAVTAGFLNKKYRRVCYNIQLCIDNPNDDEMFRLTELYPMKNTICLLGNLSY